MTLEEVKGLDYGEMKGEGQEDGVIKGELFLLSLGSLICLCFTEGVNEFIGGGPRRGAEAEADSYAVSSGACGGITDLTGLDHISALHISKYFMKKYMNLTPKNGNGTRV